MSDTPTPGQKIALVTGAGAGGIGGSLATQLHQSGYFVLCAVRRPETAEPILKPGMSLVQLDVSSTESVQAAVETVSKLTGGKLDVLVNNAGSATHRPALDLDIDTTVAQMFDVNVLGVMRMVKAFSELLISAKGCIVNIGSVAPIAPLVYSSAYNATKAALHAYGDCLSMELKPFGVQVVTVITGGVKSNIVREHAPSLPTASLYRPLEKFWLNRVTQSQDFGMDTDEYAASVVRMINRKSKPLWFWAGGKVLMVKLVYYLIPKWLRLKRMANSYGLGSFRP